MSDSKVSDPHTITALIDAIAPTCKANGIRRIRAGEIEIEFGPSVEIDPAELQRFQDVFEKGLPSDEEVLMHSAPGFVPRAPGVPLEPPKTARGRRA